MTTTLTATAELLVVDALSTGSGLHLVDTACRLGLDVAFLVGERRRFAHDLQAGLLADPPANLRVVEGVDTIAAASIAEAIRDHGREGCAVIAQSDRSIAVAAEACEATGRRFLAPDVARRCRDKHAFRRACDRAGVASVRYAAAADEAAVRQAAAMLGLPLVVKPPLGTASLGVRLAASADEAVAAARALWATGGGPVLLEEYLPGPLVSAELFRHRGTTLRLGLTDRVLSDPPDFAELSWTFPLRLGPAEEEGVFEAAEAALDAVGFDSGPAHVELVLTGRGPRVVELNPRMAGRGLSDMVSGRSAYDVYELTIRAALDMPLPPPRTPAAGYASEWVVTGSPAGHIPEAAVRAVRALPGVRHVRLVDPARAMYAHAGLVDLGEVRATGSTFAEAQMRARAGAQALAHPARR
jgi:cysteine synthase A